MTNCTRRSFLKGAAGTITAVAACGSCSQEAFAGWLDWLKGGGWLSLGKLADLPDGQFSRIEKAIRVDGGREVKTPKLILLRKGNTAYVMSTKCTHFGAEVTRQDDGTYLCPLHKAAFDKNGAVTKGPARKSLTWYEVRISDDGLVQVNIGKPVDPPKEEEAVKTEGTPKPSAP